MQRTKVYTDDRHIRQELNLLRQQWRVWKGNERKVQQADAFSKFFLAGAPLLIILSRCGSFVLLDSFKFPQVLLPSVHRVV